MKNINLAIIIVAVISIFIFLTCDSEKLVEERQKELLIRCDDIGMNHSVNLAMKEVINSGIPFSVSVMFTCPWYQEAVEILKENPQVSVGIHLVLNAEWKNYRWGPVLGKEAVPTLVDHAGFFFPSRKLLYENNPNTDEVKAELIAQIDRAFQTGLKIDYMDYHMGTAVSNPEWRLIVEELAKEHGLGIARYFGEVGYATVYNVPPAQKADSLLASFQKLDSAAVNLLVSHIGLDNPEMNALIDLNDEYGLPDMSKHRYAELKVLTSSKFRDRIVKNNIKLITYRDLISKVGLESMQRPQD